MKKFLFGIATFSLATSVLLTEANASILVPDSTVPGTIAGSSMWLAQIYNVVNDGEDNYDYGIDLSAVSSAKFTFEIDLDNPEFYDMALDFFEGQIGGAVVLSCNGGDIKQYDNPDDPFASETEVWSAYNWQYQSWWGCEYINSFGETINTNPNTNDDNPVNDVDLSTVNLGDYTYTITADFVNPLSCETDKWEINKIEKMQVCLQEWGNDLIPIEIIKCEILDSDGNVLIWFDGNGNPSRENIAQPDIEEPAKPELIDPDLAPVTLQEVEQNDTQGILLNWFTNTSADGYIVEVYNNGEWDVIKRIEENTDKKVTSSVIDGLSEGTIYKFRVKAYIVKEGVEYHSTPSNEVSGCTIPPALEGLDVIGVTSDSITLSWDKSEKADGYTINQYFSKDGYMEWKQIAKIEGVDNTVYTITGLKPSTKYSFRVHLYKQFEDSTFTGFAGTISTNTISPDIENFSVKSRTYNSITCSWDENAIVSGYIIEQYKNGEWVNIAEISDNSVTEYKIANLTPNTEYIFRVSTYMSSITSTILGNYTDTLTISTAPAQTQGFAITGRGSDYLTITWTKNAGASGYIIQEQVNGAWKNVASIKGNATTSYTVANLQPNSFHRYRMVAYKTDANGTCYGKYTGSVPGYTAPAMVSNFKVSNIGADSLTVSWDKVTSANGYVIDIYRDGKWSQLAKINSNATTSYKATGLTLGTTYKFRIKSYATNGTLTIYSTYSSAISGVPTLSKVENLRMTNRGTDFISVRWDKNESADGYMVYIYDGTKWTCVKTLTTASSVSHKITGLTSGKAYKVTVKAYKTVNGTKYISDTATISANTL